MNSLPGAVQIAEAEASESDMDTLHVHQDAASEASEHTAAMPAETSANCTRHSVDRSA